MRAADILRSLDWRDRAVQLRQLDELRDHEREALVAALQRLPADAKVDLPRLIEEMRRQSEERVHAPQADMAAGFLYYCSIAPLDQLKQLKRELIRTGDVEAAMAAAERVRASITSEPPGASVSRPVQEATADDQPRSRRRVRRRRQSLRRDTTGHHHQEGKPRQRARSAG